MARVRTTKSSKNLNKCQRKAQRKSHRRQRKQRQQRQMQQMRSVNIGRAARNPKASPRARGCLATHFWKRFKLSEHLKQVGVFKEGLPLGHIMWVVMLFGLLNATSLANVVEEMDNDVVLCAILDIDRLEEKQVYRGLAMLTVADYRAWMQRFLRELQKEPRTASRREGVIIGDGTQVRRPYSQKRGKGKRWLRVIYLHSEKRFDFGYELESTHYADWEKDYPGLAAMYEPSPEQEAAQQATHQRQALGLDLRRTADRIAWLKHQVTQEEMPEWIELGGRDLNAAMRAVVDGLNVPWVGVSGPCRAYRLSGRSQSQTANELLEAKRSRHWLDVPDLGYQLWWLGAATCAMGKVVLLMAEHMDSGERQLYVLPPQTPEKAITLVTRVLERDQDKDGGRLDLMVALIAESLQAGILAETGVFDRGYMVPAFILKVLALGLRRVIIPAKKGFNYSVAGTVYALPDLWTLLTEDEFQDMAEGNRSYQVASRLASINGLGVVQLVFVRQLSRRHHHVLRSFVLVCTDVQFAPAAVLRAYLLRWKIEVGYREVKQHHAFGCTLSTELEVVYGHLVLSFLAYTCLSVTRLLTVKLRDKTLGWIKRHYFNAIVELRIAPDGELTVLFPPWLLDSYGLPEYCMLC
jgi:hypothetical protein